MGDKALSFPKRNLKQLAFFSFLSLFAIFPSSSSLADTPGATNYIDPTGYPSSWPSSWTVYTVDGQPLVDSSGDDTTGGANPTGSGDVAPCGGGSVFFSGDTNNLYFRLCLEDNPSGNNTDPYKSSGSWTLLIDVDGDGYREFVITLDGKSSQNFDDEPDNLYVLYKNDQRQDFSNADLQIGSGGNATVGNAVLWVQDSAEGNPETAVDGESGWEVSETNGIRDFKRTRVVDRNDGTYYLDIQVPLAALDATNKSGPKITTSTPIALAFATANSNTDPIQKDLAFPGVFNASADEIIPFGDGTTIDGTPRDQPMINSVSGGACGTNSTISAEVIDSLKLENGSLVSSISQVEFFYYADLDNDGNADDGQTWVSIGNGLLATDTINPWSITWDTTSLFQGQYLLKAIATDDQTPANVVDSIETDSSNANYNSATNGTTPIVGTLDNTGCGVAITRDYGDAPDPYGDASHEIPASPNLYLGKVAPDDEADTQLTSAASTGDDDDGNDDEDAFIFLPNVPLIDPSITNLSLGRNYNLTVPLTNTTGSDATLHAWIDFNQNGKFESEEYQTATVNNNDISASLSWDIPLTTIIGDTHARFRLTSDTLTDDPGLLDPLTLINIDERSLGNVIDGEVEDYPVSVSVPLYDYGDAPDEDSGTISGDYQTTESDGGPSHVVVDTIGLNLSLGENVDGDDGSLQNDNADADDVDGTNVDLLDTILSGGNTGLNDEDGVTSFPTLTATPSQTYTVPVTVSNNIPLLDAFLVGYIDFNQDGDFNDDGEKSATVTVPPITSVSASGSTSGSSTTVSGSVDNSGLRTVNVTFTVPADVTPGETYARFRLGSIQEIVESATGVSVSINTGEINNGEVEDYKIEVAEATNNENTETTDYGDAPDPYGDASHEIPASPNLYLGKVAPDGEADTQLTSAASAGDDDDGNDDEDAFVVLPNIPLADPALTQLSVGRDYNLTVPVTNTTGSDATLHAWIDFNQNNKFEAEEYQTATVSSGQDSVSLNWDMGGILDFLNLLNLPLDTFLGDTHARFRLTSDTLTDQTGLSDVLNLGIDDRSVGNATNGEVEDYPVSVSVPLYDYGDAPDTGTGTGTGNYKTTESDEGPTHVVIQDPLDLLHLSLGENIDGDDGSLQNDNADADDVDTRDVDILNTVLAGGDTGLDDEDGVVSFPTLTATPGQTYTVPVTVRNNIPLLNAFLVGYIDFNRDGDFDDQGEKSATVTVPSDLLTVAPDQIALDTSGEPRTFNVNFTIPDGVIPGDTYARFRLGSIQEIVESATTLTVSTNNGEVNNGEVEDYQVVIVDSSLSPLASQLIINEVLYAQTGANSAAGNDEFIELFNASSNSIDLENFQLIDGNLLESDLDGTSGSITGNTSPYVFPSGTILQPGEYAVIWVGDQNDSGGSQIPERFADGAAFQAWLEKSPKLNNSGDDVWLYDADDKIIDYIAYGLTSSGAINTPPDSSLNLWDSTYENQLNNADKGQSISLTPNGIDGNTSACWEKTAIATTSSDSASSRCTGFLETQDTDTAEVDGNRRITSVGKNNNGTTNPELILVKRITNLNPNPNSIDFTAVIDDGISENNDPNWANNFLQGQISVNDIQPGDEVEYTIYFLSNGTGEANQVKICDVVPDNMSFVENSFDIGKGMRLFFDSTTQDLTNIANDDQGEFYSPDTNPPTFCQQIDPSTGNLVSVDSNNNNSGAVVIKLDNPVSSATSTGTPSDSYGYIRFWVRVQ